MPARRGSPLPQKGTVFLSVNDNHKPEAVQVARRFIEQGGGGKIILQPNSVLGRDGDDLLLRNYEGKEFRYPDPVG